MLHLPERMKEIIDSAGWLHFFLMTSDVNKLPTKSIVAGLVQTAIISIIAGAVSAGAIVLVMKTDIEYLKQGQREANEWYKDTQGELHDLEKYVYQHHGKHE